MDPPSGRWVLYKTEKKRDRVRKKERRQKETVINKPASVATGLWSCFCLCLFLLVPEGAGADKAAAGRGRKQKQNLSFRSHFGSNLFQHHGFSIIIRAFGHVMSFGYISLNDVRS